MPSSVANRTATKATRATPTRTAVTIPAVPRGEKNDEQQCADSCCYKVTKKGGDAEAEVGHHLLAPSATDQPERGPEGVADGPVLDDDEGHHEVGNQGPRSPYQPNYYLADDSPYTAPVACHAVENLEDEADCGSNGGPDEDGDDAMEGAIEAGADIRVATGQPLMGGVNEGAVEEDDDEVGEEVEEESDDDIASAKGTFINAVEGANADADPHEGQYNENDADGGEDGEEGELLVHGEDVQTEFDEPKAPPDGSKHADASFDFLTATGPTPVLALGQSWRWP